MDQSRIRVLASSVEQYIQPVAKVLMRNKHLTAIRDGFQLAMPFIFVGCLFVPILFPPFKHASNAFASAWLDLSYSLGKILLPTYQLTLGVVALIVSFGVSSSLAKQYQLPERLSGLTGGMAFLLLSGFYGDRSEGFEYLGGAGLFTALIGAVFAVEVIRLFVKQGWIIKMPEEVPILTQQSFKLILPITAVMLSISIFNALVEARFGLHFPQLIEQLLTPLVLASDSLPALLVAILICQLLWFIGIHGSLIVTGIMNPFWMSMLLKNQEAYEAGAAVLPHIFLQGFWDFFLLIGGVGSTLPLVYMAIKSRSHHLKSVGKVGAVPSLFNINEPILFGFPIILNPLFLIPFVLVPMLNATIAWYLTQFGILDRALGIIPWSVPAPIGAMWTGNGSLANGLMVILAMVNSYFMYLPFFRSHEKVLLEQQKERAKKIRAMRGY